MTVDEVFGAVCQGRSQRLPTLSASGKSGTSEACNHCLRSGIASLCRTWVRCERCSGHRPSLTLNLRSPIEWNIICNRVPFFSGGARHGSARHRSSTSSSSSHCVRRHRHRRTRHSTTSPSTIAWRPATPVARFLAQFNQDNVATLPAKLKEFIGEQKYDLHFPQASGDLTLDVAAKAAADVPAATVSTASLTAAIEAATSKSLADLYAADAATSQRNAIWDNYYAFYVLSRYEGQDLGALTTNLRTYHLLNLLYRKRPVADAATLQGILNATPIIDKVFTTLPTPAMPAPAGTDTKLPAQTVTRYKNLWTDLANITHAIAEVRTVPLTASARNVSPVAPGSPLSSTRRPSARRAPRRRPPRPSPLRPRQR